MPMEQGHDWSDVSFQQLVGYALASAVILWLAHTEQQWVYVIDSTNLAFHEAGHLIYGVLGHRMALYGGTLGQLTFPLIAAWVFYRQRKTASLGFAMLWLGENFSTSPATWLMPGRRFCRWRAQRLTMPSFVRRLFG